MNLSDEQLERYSRHIILKEIGGVGQKKLLAAHVAIIGAGGIGSPVIQYMAAAGIGRLTIIDDDLVSLSNLQRQTIFKTCDVGAPKTEKAAAFVQGLNPDVAVTIKNERLDIANAERLIVGADIVIDGSDNFETRLIVSDTATRLHIPLVSAAIGEFDGQLGIWRGWEADMPCYRCLTGPDPGRAGQSCSEQGIIGAMAGVVGNLAAMEAIRALTGFGENSAGQLLLVDALTLRFRTIAVAKDPGCPICAG